MADADRILRILLQLRADTAGATETQAALKQVEAQAATTSTTVQNVGTATSGAGALTGLLAGGFAVAAAAAYGVFRYVEYTVGAQLRLNEEVARQNEQIDRAVTGWIRLADTAEKLSDQVKIGDKAETEINHLSEKMRDLRIREINAFSTWGETIESIVRKAIGFTDLTGVGGALISSQTFGQQAAGAQLEATQRAVASAVRDANVALNIAAEETRTWVAATANLPRGIEIYTQKVAEAQKRLEAITAQAQANPTDRNILGVREEALRQLEDAQRKLQQLTGDQAKLATETDKVAAAISRANFEGLDPAHKLEQFDTEVLGIQSKLLELGVAAESPNEALAKAASLASENQHEVIGLANAWAQVVAMITRAVAEQARLTAAGVAFDQHLATVNATAYGTRDDAYKAEWGEKYNKILAERQRLGKDISAESINEQISAEEAAADRKKIWAEEDRGSAKAVGSHKEFNALLRDESTLLAQIRFDQQLISQNPFLSVDQKQGALLQSYQQEMRELGAEIQRQQSYIEKTSLDPSQLARARAELGRMQNDMTLLGQKMQTLSFGGGLRSELVSWVNSFGTASRQVAGVITGTLNTAIGATSQALTGLIFRTGNWKQAFAQAAQSIIGNIIQVALQFVVSRTLMAALNRVVGTTEGSAATAQASAAAAAWSPAAVSASIASYGAASGAGLAAYLAALAAGTAGATAASGLGGVAGGGLAGGGRVPGSPSTRDNIVLPMATGEHVINATAAVWADQHFGADFLDNLNAMRVPVRGGLADGGRIGSSISNISNYNSASPASDREQHINVFIDPDQLRKHVFDNPHAEHRILDVFKRRRLAIGIP